MSRRRKLLIVSLVSAPLAVIGVACTFPEVTYREGVDGGDTNVDGNPTSDVHAGDGGEGIIVDDSGKPIEIVSRDAASLPDAAGCDARCDCDDDGYLDKNKDFCQDGGTSFDDAMANLPGDCDDLDPDVHPNQVFSNAAPRPGSPDPGNWNCDDKVERSPEPGFKCEGIGLGLCTNNGANGKFKNEVPCGALGDTYTCEMAELLGCTEHYLKTVRQACK